MNGIKDTAWKGWGKVTRDAIAAPFAGRMPLDRAAIVAVAVATTKEALRVGASGVDCVYV